MPIDPETQLTAADLTSIRGPYVRKPARASPPREWLRWAHEIARDAKLAQSIIDADAKKEGKRAQ